jgi:hypothetical protein
VTKSEDNHLLLGEIRLLTELGMGLSATNIFSGAKVVSHDEFHLVFGRW